MFMRKAHFLFVRLASLTDGHRKSKELAASRVTEGRPRRFRLTWELVKSIGGKAVGSAG